MNLKALCKRIGLVVVTMALLFGSSIYIPESHYEQTADESEIHLRKMGFGLSSHQAAISVGPGAKVFKGGKLTLVENHTASQMLSVIIETKEGKLIVVDGGTDGDAAYLLELLRAKGGHVSAWLVTHPHSDHVGALTEILNNADSRITIDNVYYSLQDQSWYQTKESYRANVVKNFRYALSQLPQERLHGDIKKNQEIWVDDVKIVVMNEPYLFDNNSINNSSVAYKVFMDGVSMLFLGDMGPDAGQRFLEEHTSEELKSHIVQMSHHGQYGVNRNVYEAIDPVICLWPTPSWLWNNDNGGGYNSGPWTTLETRRWMEEIGVRVNYSIKDGDQVIE